MLCSFWDADSVPSGLLFLHCFVGLPLSSLPSPSPHPTVRGRVPENPGIAESMSSGDFPLINRWSAAYGRLLANRCGHSVQRQSGTKLDLGESYERSYEGSGNAG
ncbi:uncharacterized protein UTRI_04710 [Ustilago trichophora]|uniref:Uncharacterized protein n=1 Tax=Ustilago trichophora TaxID=86804 RepID=A0A5C3ECC3_9BASI|nr:uncharacterized protein UTRI_04710 [Ustilago trichophora]